jgi:hypothetical protein
MKTGTKWGIALGAGIPGVLILIGVIGLLIKFFMKRCRKKAWDDIRSLPKHLDSSDNSTNRLIGRQLSSEREPLYQPTTTNNNVLEVHDGHIAIPIDENDLPPGQRAKQHDHTLVQIQRDRLNRLKEEENRSRPMLRITHEEDDVQRAIEQAQKEFDESV